MMAKYPSCYRSERNSHIQALEDILPFPSRSFTKCLSSLPPCGGKAMGVRCRSLTRPFFVPIAHRVMSPPGPPSVPLRRKTETRAFTVSYCRAAGDWNKLTYRPRRIRPLSKKTASLSFCASRSNSRFSGRLL
jgi:hypothetical protein